MSLSPAQDRDTLTVTKGPEDGVTYRLTCSPFKVGRGDDCLVRLTLDVTVQDHHARLSAARHAYRVRSAAGARVYVDGKRVGHVRSRKLRSGGVLKVGYTELILNCSPTGLSAARRGPILEADVVWIFRHLLGGIGRAAGLLLRPTRAAGLFAFQNWLVLLALGLIAAFVFSSEFRETVLDTLHATWSRLQDIRHELE